MVSTVPAPPPNVLIVLATGFAVSASAVVLFAWWLRLPVHGSCPECGESTAAVAPEGLLRPIGESVWMRWCPECAWKGLARRGPDLSAGPVDHGSGFRWGDARLPPDMGFRWARRAPPSHPSGFRWAAGADPAPDAPEARDGDRRVRVAEAPAETEGGFRWGEETVPGHGFNFRDPDEDRRGFRWGDEDSPRPDAPDAEDEGFRWGDARG